ncbi:hypothetical protein B0E53_06397 [Micromonospora sp. MH33]|uniref:hypothetical protein n=1 Tax=Micromonospora sp. MH33 TaxID=1945509 RepID=UPI000D147CD1|nr:hypothetical protein [Micromonospora sp. MH33]PSK61698.1 hypothetical protein B0E53_06397 [Micromonospora sp. MH33]
MPATAATKPISTGIGRTGALVAVAAGLYPAMHDVYWAIPQLHGERKEDAGLPVSWRRWTPVIQRARR